MGKNETADEITSFEDLNNIVNREFGTLDETDEPVPVVDEPIDETDDETVTTPDSDTLDEEAYVPNFEYNVKDEVKQFDERFHGIVKTKEDEEYIRDMYTKADGLDLYKDKLTAAEEAKSLVEQGYQEAQDKLSITEDFYKGLVEAKNKGDYRKVAADIGWTDDDMLKAAMAIAQERELPVEQQEATREARDLAYNNAITAKRLADQQANLEHQQSNIESKAEQATINAQYAELDTAIATEYKGLDTQLSSMGLSLKQEVINTGRGMAYESANGVPPSVNEAVLATAAKYANFNTKVDNSNTVLENVVEQRKGSLPVISGSNANVVEFQPQSMEDLRKELDKLQTQRL